MIGVGVGESCLWETGWIAAYVTCVFEMFLGLLHTNIEKKQTYFSSFFFSRQIALKKKQHKHLLST